MLADAGAPSKPKTLIVGGSIAGCCAALTLGKLGCHVDLFERTTGELKSQGAGLVIQPDMAEFLVRYGIVDNVVSYCA
jgi:2-polyprenyl-6-methoxyphenol hydroxylase-like FAD-dependent oxidoreductase